MKNIWYCLKDIIFSYLVLYVSIIVLMLGYVLIGDNTGLINNIDAVYKCSIVLMGLLVIPLSIYLYKKNKHSEEKVKYLKILIFIILGISLSIAYNMIVFDYIKDKEVFDTNIYVLIIYSVILGPIFEEILFRYTALNKARERYTLWQSIIMISLVFALLHSGLINMIYAFILGLLVSYVYVNNGNILYPMVMHIAANGTSLFINNFNIYLLIISLIVIVIYLVLFIKKRL